MATLCVRGVTGQLTLDRHTDAGVFVAVDLVNRLVVDPEESSTLGVLKQVLGLDPPSVRQLRKAHVAPFLDLAGTLHDVFSDLDSGDDDAAAVRLNAMLASHPAHPYLAKEEGAWRMHHHPSNAPLVPMWTSICAEALARLLTQGHAERIGRCADGRCGRVFIDTSRNATRRHCSTTCQNRMKTAALRRRRNAGG